ncbi:x intrinsic protein, partial [Genlisea aurea]
KAEVYGTLSEILGFNELPSLELWRASVGEFVGSAVLTFMLDTVTIATTETIDEMQPLILSALIGLTLTILFLAVAPISGGFVNPMISLSAALVGLISFSRAAVYIAAECLGAILGVAALKSVISYQYQEAFSLCGCSVAIGGGMREAAVEKAFLTEFFSCFAVLFLCVWMAFDFKQIGHYGRVKVFSIIGIVVALVVFVSISVTNQKGYTGAGMNPAKCFASAVVKGGHLWDGHWVFWVGPTLASVVFYLYTKIIPRHHFQAKPYDHDFSNVVELLYRAR